MQNDFVDGSLGTPEACAIAPAVIEKARTFEGTVAFTLDTHGSNYASTQEGKNLPVAHCIKGTPGWQLIPGLEEARQARGARVFEKPTFGSVELAQWLVERDEENPITSIEFIGSLHRHLRGEQRTVGQGLPARDSRARGRFMLCRRYTRST